MKTSLAWLALPVLSVLANQKSSEPFGLNDIIGTWQGNCGPISSTGLPGDGSFTRRYNFDRSLANVRYIFFQDHACAKPDFSFYAVFGLDLGPAIKGLPHTRALLTPFIKLTVRPDSDHGAELLASCNNATVIGLDTDVSSTGCPALGFKPLSECIGDHDLLRVIPGHTLTAGFRNPNMCLVEGQPKRTENDVLATYAPNA